MTARAVLDGIRARLTELHEDRAKAAMWRTTDVARLVDAVEGVLGLADQYDHEADRLAAKAENYIQGEYRSRYLGYAADTRMKASLIRAAIEAALTEDPQ